MNEERFEKAWAEIPKMDKGNFGQFKLSVLGKGNSGTGKSHFATTIPGKTLVVCADKNRETYAKAISEDADIDVVLIDKWNQFETLVSGLEHRKLECDTVVIDTVDMLLKNVMWPDVQGAKSKISRDDWGIGLARQIRLFDTLTSLTEYKRDKAYNLVVMTHLKPTYQGDGEDATLHSYEPSLLGQFGGMLESYFNYVFLFDSNLKREGTSREKEFFMWTIPPDKFHTCKAPKSFPNKIPNTWDALQETLNKG